MKDRKLASRYARALLAAVPDPAAHEQTDAFLTALGRAFESSADLRDAMLDPAVPREGRRRVLRSIAESRRLPNAVLNFLDMLVENNRVAALPTIAVVFHEERERREGVVSAEMSTAAPLDESMKQRAHAAVEKLTGRRVLLRYRVEPELLGGAVTRVGSMVYDGSLRTHIARLRRRMAAPGS